MAEGYLLDSRRCTEYGSDVLGEDRAEIYGVKRRAPDFWSDAGAVMAVALLSHYLGETGWMSM